MTELSFNAGTAAGLLFAVVRVAGVVLGAPQLSRRVPRVGQTALAVSIGLFLAVPVPEDELGLASMISGVVANLAVGLVLGFVSTLILHMFAVAGAVLDLTSGLSVSSLYDPLTGTNATVFERFFDLLAVTIFFILGGPRLLVAGLAQSTIVVPLWGSPNFDAGLADLALEAFARFFVAGIEIAIPALAALFLAEVVLGVAARMLPEANIFLLGLPVKLLIALGAAGAVLLSFPTYAASGLIEVQDGLDAVLRGLG